MITVWVTDFLVAVAFLTRIPVPHRTWHAGSLGRATKFFPFVGVFVGASAAALYLLLDLHLPRLATAAITVVFLVCLTGSLHEDGLADVADGFGGGHGREQVLTILRDSRIGSYGGAALVLSLTCRIALLSVLSRPSIFPVLIAAHMLCRWTTLPLSRLPAARRDETIAAQGQGASITGKLTTASLISVTACVWTLCLLLLRLRGLAAILITVLVTSLSGRYYKHRIGGVTGDCFGATNQLTEVAVYLCGVWTL